MKYEFDKFEINKCLQVMIITGPELNDELVTFVYTGTTNIGNYICQQR